KTIERYRQLAGYVLTSDLALIPLVDLRARHIEPILYGLLRAPALKREHLSVKTVHHIASVIRGALQDAFRLEKIDANPMLRVKLPPIEKRKARALSRQEIDDLMNVCLNDWTRPFIQLARATGCRRGELLALLWTDIDFEVRHVVISKSL